MQESADTVQVNWDLEYYDEFKQPVVYGYEYDFKSLLENDPNYLDFLPLSAIRKDLHFQELSSVGYDYTLASEGAGQLEELKKAKLEDTEVCGAALTIAANIPTPESKTMSSWRTFISTAYFHPNILAHEDVKCVKELFQLFGSDICFANAYFMVELGKNEKEMKPVVNLRPNLESSQSAPVFTFAHIKEFSIESEIKICIVRDYSIMSFMKNAIEELVNFIVEYPEALYLETYGFVLDFLLRFGIRADVIIDVVMRTQRRRRKSQKPASVLVLKQANRLGKEGKKEFLQKKLLCSPEKKYDPVVPIATEPSPVRHLRSRKMDSSLDEQTSSDPCDTSNLPIISNDKDTTTISSNPSTGRSTKPSKKMKRKLFQESTANDSTTGQKHANISVGLITEQYKSASGRVYNRRKKRFYHRRDDSLLVKAFSCTICKDRSFTYKGNLVVHMKKHHGKMGDSPTAFPRFLCPVCLKSYSNKYRCSTHILQAHPDSESKPLFKDSLEFDSDTSKANSKGTSPGLKSEQDESVQEGASLNAPIASLSSGSHDSNNELSSSSNEQKFNFHMESGLNVTLDALPFSSVDNSSTLQQQRFQTAVK